MYYGTEENEKRTFSGDDVSWDTSGIVVSYKGGVQYAKLRIGNEAGGYQVINVPITIEDRTISAIDLSMIRDKYEFDPYLEDVGDSKFYPTNPYGATKTAIVVFSAQTAQAYPMTWDLSGLEQSYKGGTSTVYARVGSDEAGWQMVPFTVVVKERIIDKMQIEAFVFDPYDSSVDPLVVDGEDSPYPTSAIAVFKDDSTHRFSNLKWDISEVYKIWNYKGGEGFVVVKFGNEYGGYQTYKVPVKVECREIATVDINEGNIITFDPYGGIDPRLEENYYKKVNVTFTGGEKGVVDVIWDLSNVINNYRGYKGGEHSVSIRVGNSVCGYQNIGGITVKILNREIVREIIGSSIGTQKIDVYADIDLATTVTVTFSDGSQRTMPVTWINEKYRTDINAPDFPNWNEEKNIDEQTDFTADARIGDSIGGYQIVPGVPVRVYKRVAQKLFIDNVQWSKTEDGKMVIDYANHYFVFDPYDGKMELPSTVQIFFDDGTDPYMKAVWDTSNVKMDLAGGVYGGFNSETTGAILRLGNARTGHIEIEFMVVVKNREVVVKGSDTAHPVAQIFTYDTTTGEKGELLSSIVNDPYLGSGFPNTVYLEFKSTGIPALTRSEGMAKTIGNWNIEYVLDADGNNVPVRASIKLGSAKAGYEIYYFDVTTVYRKITVPDDVVVEVNPYQVSLPATLTVNVGGAVKYNSATGKYEALPVSVCGCESCVGYCGTVDPVTGELTLNDDNCTCAKCKSYLVTLKADWSKTTIDYSYPVVNQLEGNYMVVAERVSIGNRNCGYQECNVKVVVLNKRVQSISVEEFDIDPYDYRTLPSSTNVTFLDNTSGELPLAANIASAVKDASNTNTSFYQGGKYTVKAYLGDRVGGYQEFNITLNVKDRTIAKLEIDGAVVAGEEDATMDIKPYADGGVTKRPDKMITAIFTDGSKAELKALWNSIHIEYTFEGGYQEALVLLVGNAEGGYQKVPVNVRNLKAVATSATAEDGFLYNTFMERSGLPDKVVVTFTEDSYLSVMTLAVVEWAESGVIDDETRTYVTMAKIGDDVAGYQWVQVVLPLAEIELRAVLGAKYEIDAYDDLAFSEDGRLLSASGGYFTVSGQIGEELTQSLYVKLLETPVYTFEGAEGENALFIKIAVGNALTGYFSETSTGEEIKLTLTVKPRVVRALIAPDGETELKEYFTGLKLDPYDMPNIVTGGKIAALIDGGAVVDIDIFSVSYKKAGDSDYKNYVSFTGGSYDMKIVVGNALHGTQEKIYSITVAPKIIASVDELTDKVVDPYEYRLPKEVNVTFTDGGRAKLSVVYRTLNEAGKKVPFGDENIVYSGGSFDVYAIFDLHGFQQEYLFKLVVNQSFVDSIGPGMLIEIDQLDGTLTLLDEIELIISGESVRKSADKGDWTITSGADGKYHITLPEGGDPGSWDLSEVDLGYMGGTYYAYYRYGNAAAGYQLVQVPVVVSEKVIDYDKLQYVASSSAGSMTLASFGNPREITAAVGEYFELPTDLWVVFKDGTRMQKHVEWDGSKVDLTRTGRYEITTTVLEQTITAYLTITESRKVMGDDVLDVVVASRGGVYSLPTTIRQNIYLRTTSGSYNLAPEPAPAKAIVWDRKPSTAVEDKYYLVGTVSNGTFSWTRTITLYVYSTYVSYVVSTGESRALGTAAGATEATVEVDAILSPASLPEINVMVYEGEAATMRRTAARWYYVNGEGERLELSAIDTTIAGAKYVLVGVIVDRAGNEITYASGEALRFTITIDENVDLKEKYHVEEGANVYSYQDEDLTHVKLTVDRGVSITAIEYFDEKGSRVAGVTYVNGEVPPLAENTYPVDAGVYTARVTLSGYGKEERVEVAYIVKQKEIAANEIVVINLKQAYKEDATYVVSYGTKYGVPLEATYEVLEGEGAKLRDGIPAAVGKYLVTIRVVSKNYKNAVDENGEEMLRTAILEVVNYYTVTFKKGENVIGSERVEEGDTVKSPQEMGDGFLYWYEEGGDDSESFNLNRAITKNYVLVAKYQSE